MITDVKMPPRSGLYLSSGRMRQPPSSYRSPRQRSHPKVTAIRAFRTAHSLLRPPATVSDQGRGLSLMPTLSSALPVQLEMNQPDVRIESVARIFGDVIGKPGWTAKTNRPGCMGQMQAMHKIHIATASSGLRPPHANCHRERSARKRAHPKKKAVWPHLLAPYQLPLGA